MCLHAAREMVGPEQGGGGFGAGGRGGGCLPAEGAGRRIRWYGVRGSTHG